MQIFLQNWFFFSFFLEGKIAIFSDFSFVFFCQVPKWAFRIQMRFSCKQSFSNGNLLSFTPKHTFDTKNQLLLKSFDVDIDKKIETLIGKWKPNIPCFHRLSKQMLWKKSNIQNCVSFLFNSVKWVFFLDSVNCVFFWNAPNLSLRFALFRQFPGFILDPNCYKCQFRLDPHTETDK